MQGKILDFSVQTNTGVISGLDNKRYEFAGSEWKEQQAPQRGMQVDFDINEQGGAVAVYSALLQMSNTNVISSFKEKFNGKTEEDYTVYDWTFKCLKNYANFQGRARRREYWFFTAFNVFIYTMTAMLDNMLGTFILFNGLFLLAVALPVLGVSVRRLHDIGRSGWWYLIVCIPIIGFFIVLYWFCQAGDEQANQYGQPSK